MRTPLVPFLVLGVLACDGPDGCPEVPPADGLAAGDVSAPADLVPSVDTRTPAPDGSADAQGDGGPPDTPPTFGPLPPVTLDMGTSAILDLADHMSDAEDPDEALVLSWSAVHVGLQDGPGHVLRVVAPVTWWGIETISLTVTDGGGLTAEAALTVTVNEVLPPEPPAEPCGEVLFSLAAPEAQAVDLAGTFNNWGNPPGALEPMADPEADGTWERVMVLE
ncbi:MAG: hypothetical protein FJ098_10150, partial [Deltaproteobacteria bacterium]|nr:hypothetical protein [Deltaproteobacteria bacterium]